jgi:hypothetical protein
MTQYSHPTEPVRHSYPVAVEKAGFATALGLFLKTLPYALVRFGILLAVSVITIVWMVVTFGGAAFLGARIHPWAGYGWMFVGLGAAGVVWRLVVRYALYLVKAGHIAVITELVTRGRVGNGSEGMFGYGKRIVTQRFGEVNVLFGLDLLIRGVVRAFNRSLEWISSLLPIPGLDVLVGIVRAVIQAATTYIDETIFSYNLARGDENPWRSGKDGLIYYCQNSKEILKTAVWVVVLDKALTLLVWVVMLAPAFAVAAVLPASARVLGGGAALLIAVLFAANIRSAFLKPIFLIMIMTRFHVLVRGQFIDATWDARLSQLSGKFRELKSKVPTTVVEPTEALPPVPSS